MTPDHKALVEALRNEIDTHDAGPGLDDLIEQAAAAIESLSERAELHRRKNDQEKT